MTSTVPTSVSLRMETPDSRPPRSRLAAASSGPIGDAVKFNEGNDPDICREDAHGAIGAAASPALTPPPGESVSSGAGATGGTGAVCVVHPSADIDLGAATGD